MWYYVSMSSDLSSAGRRVPQQERASRRVTTFLDRAAELFAEVGYEAATMTVIAERSNASIGSVYQYFPDKEAVAQALTARSREYIDSHVEPLIAAAPSLSAHEIAVRLIDLMVGFYESHPEYLPLSEVRVKFARREEARHELRSRLADAFTANNPKLTHAEAWLTGNVALQIVKGFGVLYTPAPPAARPAIAAEFKTALSAYLATRLSDHQSPPV